MVGWEDESTMALRVCTRQFTADLKAFGGEKCTMESEPVSRVSLFEHGGQLLTSYRVDSEETSVYQVRMPSGGGFVSEPVPSPAYNETLALVALNDSTLLAVYVDGNMLMRASVLDYLGNPMGPAIVLGGPRGRPSLAKTNDGVHLSWWEPAESPYDAIGWDPVLDELWLQRLGWKGSQLDVHQAPIPLPREDVHRLGDQVLPSIASVPYAPKGALVAVWTDLSGDNYNGQTNHAEVVIELVPTPVLRLTGGL